MSIDLTQILAQKGITDLSSITESLKRAAINGDISDATLISDFSALLDKESEKLSGGESKEFSEMQALIDSLDKSILGTVKESIDPVAVAADLLNDGDAGEVIGSLIEGHLNGIALSDSSDLDSEDTIRDEASLRTGDKTMETLAENLESVLAGLGQIVT